MIGLAEARRLLRASGFEPVAVRGYGYVLHRTERLPFAPIVGAVEKRLQRETRCRPSLSTSSWPRDPFPPQANPAHDTLHPAGLGHCNPHRTATRRAVHYTSSMTAR